MHVMKEVVEVSVIEEMLQASVMEDVIEVRVVNYLLHLGHQYHQMYY